MIAEFKGYSLEEIQTIIYEYKLIEDDIQLPLTVFYKLFKYVYIDRLKPKITVYTIYSDEDLYISAVAFKDKHIGISFKDKTKLNAAKWSVQRFDEYGKTWSLNKEDLQK